MDDQWTNDPDVAVRNWVTECRETFRQSGIELCDFQLQRFKNSLTDVMRRVLPELQRKATLVKPEFLNSLAPNVREEVVAMVTAAVGHEHYRISELLLPEILRALFTGEVTNRTIPPDGGAARH